MTGGDVVTPADEATARRLDSRIRLMAGTVRDGVEKIAALVEQAKAGQIHLTLGFHSWTAYLADVLGGNLAIDASIRQELMHYLSNEGMSQRAIASATGTSKGTVHRELTGAPNGAPDVTGTVTGLDDKNYPKKKAPAKKAPAKKAAPKLTVVKDETVDLDATPGPDPKSDTEKATNTKIEQMLIKIAGDLNGIANYVAGLDFDAKTRWVAEHQAAFNEVGKQHRRTISVLKAAEKKHQQEAAAKQEAAK